MAPMTTGFASHAGRPSRRLVAWYGARAAGGAALVIVEETLVLDDERTRASSPRKLRLAAQSAIPSFRALAETIKRGGAVAALQLAYPRADDLLTLSFRDVARIVAAFGEAALRAEGAGFQAVEVQASPGRFLGQLLSPLTNKRRDRYGRAPGGRMQALIQAVGAIRTATSGRVPVLVRFSADERDPTGITLHRALEIARALETAGVAALEIVGGAASVPPTELLSSGVGEATRVDLAAAVKQAVSVPVIANGRIVTGDSAAEVVTRGQAHLVSLGRALLADPAWAAKHRAGIENEIAPCIGCMACFTPAPDGGIGCPVNGDAGHEYLPPLVMADQPRRVAVLGASLAGLELARVAAARGHDVSISTAGLPLGGLLGLRAGVPGNAEFGRAFLYAGDRLRELGVFIVDDAAPGADVLLDCRAGAERRPPWLTDRGTLLAGELLGRDLHEMYGIGRRVAVVGYGALAAEVALFLGGWGRRCTVVVSASENQPFPDVHPNHAARLRERLEGYKVPIVAGATVRAWHYDTDRKSELDVTRNSARETLGPFHTVVSAAGWTLPRPWPQRTLVPRLPRLPKTILAGTVFALQDTPYPEPLRDQVTFANLLARVI